MQWDLRLLRYQRCISRAIFHGVEAIFLKIVEQRQPASPDIPNVSASSKGKHVTSSVSNRNAVPTPFKMGILTQNRSCSILLTRKMMRIPWNWGKHMFKQTHICIYYNKYIYNMCSVYIYIFYYIILYYIYMCVCMYIYIYTYIRGFFHGY